MCGFCKQVLALVVIASCLLSVGCEGKETEDIKIMMTSRQEDILISLGLPVDWEKLTLRQKDAIVAIEEMMAFVEKKYNEEFMFVSYEEEGVNHIEMLTLCPINGVIGLDSFAVWRETDSDKECFKDEYYVAKGRKTIERIIKTEIVNNTSFEAVKVYVVVLSASEDGFVNDSIESIDARISGVVFIEAETIIEDELNEVTELFNQLSDSSQLTGGLQIVVVPEEVFNELSESNYLSAINNEKHIRRESVRF